MAPPSIKPETVAKMLTLRAEGMTCAEIARRLGVSNQVVSKYAPAQDAVRAKLVARIAAAHRLAAEGLTNVAIGRRLCVNAITIGRYLREPDPAAMARPTNSPTAIPKMLAQINDATEPHIDLEKIKEIRRHWRNDRLTFVAIATRVGLPDEDVHRVIALLRQLDTPPPRLP